MKTMMKVRSQPATIAASVVLGVLALAGCREGEQDRLLNYEPGVYQGQLDTPAKPLDEGQLRSRAMQIQNFN